MASVFYKELADHFGRRRFTIFAGMIVFAGLWAGYVAYRTIRGAAGDLPADLIFLNMFTSSSGLLPPFLFFLSFFGPLLGISLGFDSINSERATGTLARTLAQPIHRDSLFNAKFLAGVATIAVVQISIALILIGIGMIILGYGPSMAASIRIFLFTVVTIVYVAFWLGLAMLFSVWFDRAVSSALTSLGLWLFFGFIMIMLAGAAADFAVTDVSEPEDAIRHIRINDTIRRFSPVTLFQETTSTLLTPTARTLGPVLVQRTEGLDLDAPLPLSQTLVLVWPHLVTIVGLLGICFTLSYIKFLREEIRT